MDSSIPTLTGRVPFPRLDVAGDDPEDRVRFKPLGQGQEVGGAPGQLGLKVPALQVHLPLGDRQADAGALRLRQVDAGGVEAVAAPDGLRAQPPQVGAHRHRRSDRIRNGAEAFELGVVAVAAGASGQDRLGQE